MQTKARTASCYPGFFIWKRKWLLGHFLFGLVVFFGLSAICIAFISREKISRPMEKVSRLMENISRPKENIYRAWENAYCGTVGSKQ